MKSCMKKNECNMFEYNVCFYTLTFKIEVKIGLT